MVGSFYLLAGTSTAYKFSEALPTRIIIHGHHPNDKITEGESTGKLIHLPDTRDDLLRLAGDKFPKNCSIRSRGTQIILEIRFLRFNIT